MLDDRYKQLNITTNELELQKEAGVIDSLDKLPRYTGKLEPMKEARKSNILNLYTRSSTSWSLACEAFHGSSRAMFYHQIVLAGLGN